MRTVCLVLVSVLALACSKSRFDETRAKRLERKAAAQSAAVDNLEKRAAQLGAEWTDITTGFREAAARNLAAQKALKTTTSLYGASGAQFDEASRTAQRAAARWELFQKLVVAAATVDAANLDAARAARGAAAGRDVDASCEAGMSTATFRTLMLKQGKSIAGLDVDHIVPRSLGGADHPLNYRLISSSLNRSLGNTWGDDKCLAVGADRCAQAIAVSNKCGSLKGLGFN